MVETYTKRGRATKQEYGSNPEAWGGELNDGALERLDDMWGTTEITVNGNVTLTASDKIADQARGFTLIMTGAGGFTVTVPALDKPYLVINGCTADVTIKPGVSGTPATSRAGTSIVFYASAAGTTFYAADNTLDKIKLPAGNLDLNSKKIVNLAPGGASSTDAANVQQVEALIASAANISVPGLVGHALQFLRVNSAANNIQWAGRNIVQVVSSNSAAVLEAVMWCDTSAGAITITLAASPTANDSVDIARFGANAVNIARNGQTIAGLSSDLTIDTDNTGVTLIYLNGGWRIRPWSVA